jgi:hypothetical protein
LANLPFAVVILSDRSAAQGVEGPAVVFYFVILSDRRGSKDLRLSFVRATTMSVSHPCGGISSQA